MKKLNISILSLFFWVFLIVSCSAPSDYSPQNIPTAKGTLVGIKAKPIGSAKNTFAFYSFLQKLNDHSTAIDSIQLSVKQIGGKKKE